MMKAQSLVHRAILLFHVFQDEGKEREAGRTARIGLEPLGADSQREDSRLPAKIRPSKLTDPTTWRAQ